MRSIAFRIGTKGEGGVDGYPLSLFVGPTKIAGRPLAMMPYSFPGTEIPTNCGRSEIRCASPTLSE